MEHLRETIIAPISLDEISREPQKNSPAMAIAADDEKAEKELRAKMLDCLERCTAQLAPESRNIIIGYYFGVERIKIENRRALARGLGISANALSIRACRIRDKLEICVGKCAAEN